MELFRPETTLPTVSSSIAGAVETAAKRFVRQWGFTTLTTVAGSFRLTRRTLAPREVLARRALDARADVAWLEPTREWFSLSDVPSAPGRAAAKVFAVAGSVAPAELAAALGKRHSFGSAPPAVVDAYVSLLAARPLAAAALEPEEGTLVEWLRVLGGLAERRALFALGAARGLPRKILRQVLAASPLFLPAGRGVVRLVGASLAMLPSPAPWAVAH
ncbi:MAG TPA: hypothetical protein VHJ20_23230 [Polyangia bacterium]|nr:hypothetical protein [Polyangia bacterium]